MVKRWLNLKSNSLKVGKIGNKAASSREVSDERALVK